MIRNQIFYLGLTRVEPQTLRCWFPISFKFLQFSTYDLEDKSKANEYKFQITNELLSTPN